MHNSEGFAFNKLQILMKHFYNAFPVYRLLHGSPVYKIACSMNSGANAMPLKGPSPLQGFFKGQ